MDNYDEEAIAFGFNRTDEFARFRLGIKKELKSKGIQYDQNASTADLLKLNKVIA